MSQRIGYIRVSSKNQNLDRQLEVMRKHNIEKVFQEKVSAKCLVWGGCPNNFISFSPKHIRRFIKNLRFNSIPFYDSVKWCFHF